MRHWCRGSGWGLPLTNYQHHGETQIWELELRKTNEQINGHPRRRAVWRKQRTDSRQHTNVGSCQLNRCVPLFGVSNKPAFSWISAHLYNPCRLPFMPASRIKRQTARKCSRVDRGWIPHLEFRALVAQNARWRPGLRWFFPVVTLRAAVKVQLRPERTEHPSKKVSVRNARPTLAPFLQLLVWNLKKKRRRKLQRAWQWRQDDF